jgi:hypothetical protein
MRGIFKMTLTAPETTTSLEGIIACEEKDCDRAAVWEITAVCCGDIAFCCDPCLQKLKASTEYVWSLSPIAECTQCGHLWRRGQKHYDFVRL